MNLSRSIDKTSESSLERTFRLVKSTLNGESSKKSNDLLDVGGKIIAESIKPGQIFTLVDNSRHKLTLGQLLGEDGSY